jgi:hypothetical protein
LYFHGQHGAQLNPIGRILDKQNIANSGHKVFQLLSFRNDHEQRIKLGLIDDRLWVAANETQKIVTSTRQTSTDSRASLISSLFSLAYLPAGIVAVNVPKYLRWVGSLRKKSLTFCVRLCSVATLLNSAPDWSRKDLQCEAKCGFL